MTVPVDLPSDLLVVLEARARARGMAFAEYLTAVLAEVARAEPLVGTASTGNRNRGQGMYAHTGIRVPDDFDAPLPDDVLRDFEGDSGVAGRQ